MGDSFIVPTRDFGAFTIREGLPSWFQSILLSRGSRFQVRTPSSAVSCLSFLKHFLPLMGLKALSLRMVPLLDCFFFFQRSLMMLVTWGTPHLECSAESLAKWCLKKEI